MQQKLIFIKRYFSSKALIAALCLFLFSFDTLCQYPLWAVGNKAVDFQNPNSDLDVTALPEPIPISGYPFHYFYNGELPNYVQHCQFDGGGNLLFFIIDGRIYNANGYLIADSYLSDNTMNWPHIGSQSQLAVTAFPGSCSKFIIFYGTQVSAAHRAEAQFVVLNLLTASTLYSDIDVQGALENIEIIQETYIEQFTGSSDYFAAPYINSYDAIENYTDHYSLALDLNSNLYDGFNSSGFKAGELHWEIIESANNGPKHIFAMIQSLLIRLKLEANGFTEIESWQIQNEGVSRSPQGEIEATYNSALNHWQIIISDTHAQGAVDVVTNILVANLDADYNFVSASTIDIGNEPAVVTDQYGLEISPNGRYAYFSISQEPHFGYVDLNDNTVHNLNFTIPNDLQYVQSKMEKNTYTDGINQAIYVSGSGNVLGAIVDPDNPLSSTWNASASLSATIGTIPSYHNYFNNSLVYRNLQNQNHNGAQIQNFLGTTGCCLAQTNISGVQGMTITTSNDGAWTYGANPFGNANAPIRIVDDLIFQTGTTTIINNMVFEFDEDANVIIEKGARVNLNGTTWTSLTCTAIMWPGVNLLGTTNTASSIDQIPFTNGDQGYLYMFNSIIEHALKGVEVGTSTLNAGGIIRAYNSKFRNNQYDVIFKRYHYISGGNYVQNKSLFNNCTFITDGQLNNPLVIPVYHAWLTEVDKISFANCSFMNKTDIGTYSWFQRGSGIFSNKASFTVDGLNDPWTGSPVDPDQTTFYKLQYGIRSFGYNNPLAFYTCKQQEFQFCLYGIVNYNTDNVQIYQNNFMLPDAAGFNSDESMERGIYLTNSTGYTVEQNFFDGFDDFQVNDDYPCALGVWVDNSGDFANEIRNNDFDEMKLGTYVTRNNKNMVIGPDGTDADDDIGRDQTGLQLLCNTYTNGQTDIFRDSETLMRQDQGGTQPQPVGLLNAGNRFSAPDCNGAISDFVVDPNNTFYNDYWCHNQPNTIPDCGGNSNVPGDYFDMELLTNSVSLETYDDADCPNTYGGPSLGPSPGLISGLVSQIGVVRAQLESAKNTYIQVVDDNQKQSTLDILSEAFPHESQYYRDLLMQLYPLSADVIRKLIEQAPRLSPWHLTEVFLANSPLSKDLLYQIEKAEILSPFFMSFLYDADSGASLKRLMEMNMLSLATERDQLIQSIARAGLTYDVDAESESDQPIFVNQYMAQLELQSGASALRIRAANKVNSGDYAAAIALIANEPLLASYKIILEMEENVGSRWSQLNAAQISALWDIYNAKRDYSSSMALSILQEIGEAQFEPEPRIPIQYRSLQNEKDLEKEKLPLLGIWPNPASNSAWLHYPIEADEHATIHVFDPQGRLISSFQPNTNGLVELSLQKYESGIYVVQLVAFDKVVESIKLTVVNQD